MSENKTKPTHIDPYDYVGALGDEVQREDSLWLMDVMSRKTGAPAKMWGPSMIGFGNYHYKYESGREGDMFLAGFAPRKGKIVIYLMSYARIPGQQALLEKLGKHKMGKGCLYIKRLEQIDRDVLEELIQKSIDGLRAAYPNSGK